MLHGKSGAQWKECPSGKGNRLREASPGRMRPGLPVRYLFRGWGHLVGFHLVRDDQVLDLVVGRLRNNFFLHQFVFRAIGSTVDDLLRIRVADAWQGLELISRSGIDVELVSRGSARHLSWGCIGLRHCPARFLSGSYTAHKGKRKA